jgi:hypothetical protein
MRALLVRRLSPLPQASEVPQQRQRRCRIVGCGVGQGEDVGAADRLAGEGVVETVRGQGLGPPGAADGDRMVMDPLCDVNVDVAELGERLLGQLDVGQGCRGHRRNSLRMLGGRRSLTGHWPATRSATSRAILCAASAPVGSSAQGRMSTSMAAAVVSARRHRQPAPC